MDLAKKITTEVANEALFDHIVNNGFSNGTAQFIKTFDAIANVATCHISNQDFLWKNKIFTPENNYRSQVECARKGIFTAFPSHNPIATAAKFVLADSISIPREKIFDMTPKPYWSHGFVGNTTNLFQTLGYGMGKIYSFGYFAFHESLSFENSITKIYDASESFLGSINSSGNEKQIYGPPNPTFGNEIYGPPNPTFRNEKQIYGPPNPTFGNEIYGPPNPVLEKENCGLPFIDLSLSETYYPYMGNDVSPLMQLPEIDVPSRIITDNGFGFRFGDSSSILYSHNEVLFNTLINNVNLNVSADIVMIKYLFADYLPAILGNIPKNVFPLSNGATFTISKEIHGLFTYETYKIDDPINGIHIGVSEYHNPNPLQDLHNKYQAELLQKNIEKALNFKQVDTLIDGSTVTYTKEVTGTIITNKIVIENQQKGIYIAVSEKNDSRFQETAIAEYNKELQLDTYINKCRLAKLIQKTNGLKPEQIETQRSAFLEKTGEYSTLNIHLSAHWQLLNNELSVINAVNICMNASYMMIYNIWQGKYKKYETNLKKIVKFTKDSIKICGKNAFLSTSINHTFEQLKLFDLISHETSVKIIPYAFMCLSTIFQIWELNSDKKLSYITDNDINAFILNKLLQIKSGIIGKGFSFIFTYFGLLEATSTLLLFGSGFVSFSSMVLFDKIVRWSISPYRDVAFATENKKNRLKAKIDKNINKSIEISKGIENIDKAKQNYLEEIDNFFKIAENSNSTGENKVNSLENLRKKKEYWEKIERDFNEKNPLAKFDLDIAYKTLEIENLIKPKITNLIINKERFIGNGFSYSFGGNF